MSIQNLAVIFGQKVFGQVGCGNEYGGTWKWGNGRRSISEQGDYPVIFFFFLDPHVHPRYVYRR